MATFNQANQTVHGDQITGETIVITVNDGVVVDGVVVDRHNNAESDSNTEGDNNTGAPGTRNGEA